MNRQNGLGILDLLLRECIPKVDLNGLGIFGPLLRERIPKVDSLLKIEPELRFGVE